jgi:hypothetical protein
LTSIECSDEAFAKEVNPLCPLCLSKWDIDPDEFLKRTLERLDRETKKK